MQKVETGSAMIHRFDGALNPAICERLCALARNRTDKPFGAADAAKLPWHDGDTFAFDHWEDGELRHLIGGYRLMVGQLICLAMREIVFPHFTDLVRWRPGKSMDEHKDDGYPGDDEIMSCRHYSAVTYCNDDYSGGETFIRNEHDGYYLSTPRTGTLVFYPSDERATHGVRQVAGGDRVTLSTWFTRDVRHYRP